MKKRSFFQRLSFAVAPALALLLGGAASHTHAAPFDSPVGDWEFYFGGKEKGVAHITFLPSLVVTGLCIYSPAHPKKPSVDPRNSSFDPEDPRGGTVNTNVTTFHYGGAIISGSWGFSSKGRPIGALTLLSSGSTNGMSFSGTVVPGRRMSFSATRDGLKSVFHGVPRAALPDISTNYFLTGKKGNEFFTEILAVSSDPVALMFLPASPNLYYLTKTGPGYMGDGFVMLTANKRMGIYTEHFAPGTTNTVITALSGTFNTTKLSGKLAGYSDNNVFSLKIGKFPNP